MLPSAHALLLCADKATTIADQGSAASSNTGGDQWRVVGLSATTAPLVRSSVIEMTGNKRNPIRHASEMASTILCPRDLQKGLLYRLQNKTKAAERTNHARLSATSKWLSYLFLRCTPLACGCSAQI